MANTPRKVAGSLSRQRQIVKTNLGAIGGTINEMEEINTKRLVCTSILRRARRYRTQLPGVPGRRPLILSG